MSLSPAQAKIVDDCTDAVRMAWMNSKAPRVQIFNDYVVKFNQATNILNEGDTQAFVYKEALKGAPNAPRVPKVYECFSWDNMEYLAMERIDCPDVASWINAASDSERQSREDMACEKVATALDWLFNLSAPLDAPTGMIEGAYTLVASGHPRTRTSAGARHRFFGADFEAPLRYTDAPALQRYINKALTYRPRSAQKLQVDFSGEPLVMNHGDIHPRNFLIDPKTGEVTIIDFGDISLLPRSFVSFTLYASNRDFIAAIAKSLCWEKSENIRAMGAAAGILIMLSGNLGLNEHGLPANTTKSRLPSPLSAPSAMVQAPILQR